MTLAPLPFDVDEAKLWAPITRQATVPKHALVKGLLESEEPFATVVAPAGYGKTTLLTQWAGTDPRPFAWVWLDGRDDDPVVFLRDIATAIHRVAQLPSAAIDALAGPAVSIWTRARSFGNGLAALSRPFVLALDDLHRVGNPDCTHLLADLFAYVPRGCKVVITSRSEPDLPLARWRATGALADVGVTDRR